MITPLRSRSILTHSIAARLGLVVAAIAMSGAASHAGSVIFGPAQTIAADTDVLAAGSLNFAYTMSNVATTVNGVSFLGSTSTTVLGTNVTIAGITGANNTNAFDDGAGNPYAALSPAYKNLLLGADYANAGTAVTLTLNNLTVGHNYATQIWINDNRALGQDRRATLSGGANAVTLDYNTSVGSVAGGVGQFATGLFNADAATQAISLIGTHSTQFNSIQLRDVTNIGYWVGSAGAAWDAATTANFASNLFSAALNTTTFNVAKAPLNAVTFADAYWDNGAQIAVTQNAITLGVGGVSTGSVLFQNNALNYTVTSSDALGITGATNVAMTGTGTVTLAGTHSFSGTTAVTKGTLRTDGAVFGGAGTLTMGGTGTLDLFGNNARFTNGLTGIATSTITDTSVVAGVSKISFLSTTNVNTTATTLIADGATRDVAVEITNANGGTRFTNNNNTFSGGLTLLHNAGGGTRLTIDSAVTTTGAPGAIVSSPFGTGPITIGQAATDRAGIYLTVGNTIANAIVFNTGLGTDRFGIRSDTTGITLSGTVTANLADATFSTNGTASFNLTGRVTGPSGLLLHNTFGTSVIVNLNNQTANPNDYAGTTTLQGTKGRINLGAANQIPNGAGKGGVLNNGTINLAGFAETINGLDGTGTVDGGSGNPLLTLGDNDANGNFTGPIINTTGILSLHKIGAGSQNLGGVNTYTGPTSVNGGKLFVNGSLHASSVVQVANGATLGGTGTVNGPLLVITGGAIESGNGSTAGTLTLSYLDLGVGPGDTSVFNLRPFASPAVNVTVPDSLVPQGGPLSSTINIIGAAPAAGTFTLIDYAGAALSPAAYGAFNLVGLPNRVSATLVDNGANTSIDLNVSLVDTARWSGALGNEWSTAVLTPQKNWVFNSDGTTQTDYLAGDTVSFTDTATTTTVDVGPANVSPASMTFNHSAKDYTLQGSAAVAGATGLTKTGAGKLTITNTNSFSGAVAIEQGIVSVATVANGGANSPLGTNSAIALGTAASVGTLQYTGVTAATNRTLTLNAGGGILEVTDSGATLTAGSIVSGGGALAKTGPGALVLANANTFTGGLNITGGTLVAGNAAALGAVGNAVSVASGASLEINSQTLQGYTQNIAIAGAGASPALGALGNTNPADNLNAIRGITLTGDASVGGNGGRWDIGRLDFNVNPTISVDHITGNGFVLTKVGGNYLGLLTGASNLAGFIHNGGIVAPHENTSFGAGPVTVNNGAIIQPWSTDITFANNFTINNGTLQNDGHNNFYNGSLVAAGPTILNPRPGGNILVNGPVSGDGAITKIGAFSVFLGGDNSSFTGSYTNNESNTFLNSATAGSASADFIVNAGNFAGRTTGANTYEFGSLAGTGGQLGTDLAGAESIFQIGANDTDTTFSGNIVNTVGGGGTTALTKVGSGTLTLAGANTYTGLTLISDGTLLVTGSLGASTVIVDGADSILGGGGSILGPVVVANGATIAPGTSPGLLSTGPLTMSAGTTLAIELNNTTPITGYDQLSITGAVDLGGATLSIGGTYLTAPAEANDLFFILLNDSTDPIAAAFASITEGSYLAAPNGQGYILTYLADSGTTSFTGGNDVALKAVPEPGSAALLLGGLAMLGWRRRRE